MKSYSHGISIKGKKDETILPFNLDCTTTLFFIGTGIFCEKQSYSNSLGSL